MPANGLLAVRKVLRKSAVARRVYGRLKRTATASGHLYSFLTDPDAARLGMGVLHLKAGRWSQAQSALSAKLQSLPEHPRLRYLLGWCHDRSYDWAAAEARYRQAIALAPDRGDWHGRLGFVLERQERFEAAATFYLQAADRDSAAAAEWIYRAGYVHARAGRFAKALEAYARLSPAAAGQDVAAVPDGDPDALAARLARDCTDPADWWTLSVMRERQDDLQGALDAMTQALWRSETHRPQWHDRQGYLLRRQGAEAAACDAFRQRQVFQDPHGLDAEDMFARDPGLREAAVYRAFYDTLPVVAETILYESFGGEGISDNPLALYRRIRQDDRFAGWRHVWVIESLDRVPDEMRADPQVFFVKKETEPYQRMLCTARYLINNATFPYYFVRKPDQDYLNTWHGTPLKTLGYDIVTLPLQRSNTARNLIQASLFIAPNAHTEEVMLDRYGVRPVFTGRSLLTGYPRIDATLNATAADREALYQALGLDPTKPVVLFAPTYRGHWATPELEADEMAATLDRMKSDDYNLVFRGHYFAEKVILEMDLPVTIAPHAIDTCRLLSIVDVLVSDYSSIFYDFLVTRRPVIHYIHDWDRYVETRGVYFGKDDLPGAICEDETTLLAALRAAIADPQGLVGPRYETSRETYCAHEDGRASERVIEALFFAPATVPPPAAPSQSKRLLIYGGDFGDRDALDRTRRILRTTQAEHWTNVVMADRLMLLDDAKRIARAQALLDRSDVLIRFRRAGLSLEEFWITKVIGTKGHEIQPEMEAILRAGMLYEARRSLGDATFDLAVDQSGDRPFWTRLIAAVNASCHAVHPRGVANAKDAAPYFDIVAEDPAELMEKLAARASDPAADDQPPVDPAARLC